MIEQKKFSLFNPKPEEDYLNTMALNGYELEKVDLQGYHFKETQKQDLYYLVEFYKEMDDIEDLSLYTSQGFELVSKFFTEKGIWLYFVGKDIVEPIQRHMSDRNILAKEALKRFEYFGLSVSGIFMVFTIFRFIVEQDVINTILIIMGVGFFGYVLYEYLKFRKEIY